MGANRFLERTLGGFMRDPETFSAYDLFRFFSYTKHPTAVNVYLDRTLQHTDPPPGHYASVNPIDYSAISEFALRLTKTREVE